MKDDYSTPECELISIIEDESIMDLASASKNATGEDLDSPVDYIFW